MQGDAVEEYKDIGRVPNFAYLIFCVHLCNHITRHLWIIVRWSMSCNFEMVAWKRVCDDNGKSISNAAI